MGIRGMLRAAVLLLLIRTWLSEGHDTTPLPEFHFELSSTVPEVVQNVFNCKNCANEAVVHKILDRVLSRYDARLRPNFGGAPVPVGISMYISSIDHISEMTMDYTITVFFHQTWKDPRLAYYETNLNLTLDYRMLEKLWVPDCYFLNSKDAFVHEMTVENRMFQLHPDGTVQYGLRLTTTAACSMNLQNFPLDKQTCKLEVESCMSISCGPFFPTCGCDHQETKDRLASERDDGYTVEDIMLYWEGDDNAIQGTEKLHIPQFTLLGKTVTSKQERFYTGSYVRLILRFLVQRGILSYLVQIYWPTVLITTGSWITFWMNYKFSVTRVTVGLTSMLILNAINSHLRDKLPQFSCIKAIDIYMVACFFFVFLSLLEYVFINYLFYSRGGTRCRHRQHRRARRIMNRYRYQPHVHQRPQEEEILSVEEINNHITSADEEGPVPPPSPKVLIHVGFESADFLSLSTVSPKGDQVNIKDEGGSLPSRSLQAYQASPESLNPLTFIPEQAPLATSESLSSLSSLSGQSWLAIRESLNDLSSTSEQVLHVHNQRCVQEACCNPGKIPRRSEEFLSMPDDVKIECGYPDLRMQFQHDDDSTWSRDGDNFMGFDQDEDSNSESGDSCPPSPGYSFSERFLYDLFDPDYVSKVDKWSRIIFPIAFVVFNVVYWPYNAI